MVGARGEHRAAERDDPGHQVGPAYGQPAREHPAQAVPDDLHPGAAPQRDRLEAALQLRGGVEGAAGVDVDRRAVGAEALLPQHARHRGERRVAGQEAGHQDHRRRVPDAGTGGVRRPAAQSAALERPEGEAARLAEGAGLAQHRSDARSGESLRRQPGCQRRCRHADKVTQR